MESATTQGFLADELIQRKEYAAALEILDVTIATALTTLNIGGFAQQQEDVSVAVEALRSRGKLRQRKGHHRDAFADYKRLVDLCEFRSCHCCSLIIISRACPVRLCTSVVLHLACTYREIRG